MAPISANTFDAQISPRTSFVDEPEFEPFARKSSAIGKTSAVHQPSLVIGTVFLNLADMNVQAAGIVLDSQSQLRATL
ncbi:MAG: hypothetical protein WKF77_11105 [Planctomycetaceae bacterium]